VSAACARKKRTHAVSGRPDSSEETACVLNT
jgi:hypothetical protein